MGVLPQVNVKILVSEIARNASKTSNMITRQLTRKLKYPFFLHVRKSIFLAEAGCSY